MENLSEELLTSAAKITDTDYAQELLALSSFQITAHIDTISLQNRLSSESVLSLLQEK